MMKMVMTENYSAQPSQGFELGSETPFI